MTIEQYTLDLEAKDMYLVFSLQTPARNIFPFQLIRDFLITSIVFAFAHHSMAQPTAIGPEDISRLQQETQFSSDWSETDAFNLDRYITLHVNIQRLDIPNRAGNVYLWFTVNNSRALTGQVNLPADVIYKATLQSADAVDFLKIDPRDFTGNVGAVIRGWPATDNNITGSVLLIDDIRFTASGKNIALHADNPKMQSRRKDTHSPPD